MGQFIAFVVGLLIGGLCSIVYFSLSGSQLNWKIKK